MKRPILQRCLLCVILFTTYQADIVAQDLRTFNQNASRSNHTRGLSIGFSPVYSTAVNNSNDSLLFRGSGAGFRFGADYFFGKASIGFSSGFSSSSPDNTTINNFLKRSAVPQDQLQITKAKQQNMYLLLGPSVRFGKTVELYAHAQAGLFVNNSGMINIQQRGATKVAYRNESTGKSVYPGFLTGLSIQYSTKSDIWSFGIGADYMNTRSEVTNYDARRGGGIEGLKLSRNITDIVTGITIRYNIFSPRDPQSGQSTGKRLLPTVNKREIVSSREAGSGMSTGKRLLPTVNKREIAIDEPGVQRTMATSCGPVTMKTTNADGSTTESTFSCPDDAAAFIVNSHSTPQTDAARTDNADPGQTRKAFVLPHVLEKSGIISGRLTWATANTTGIINNAVIGNSISRNGSTTLNSQTSSTRTTPNNSFGTMVRISAREAGSGMATGRRSREAGSGLATGRRQYEPIFIENGGDICNPCLATAKLSSVKNNPLYEEKNQSGANPLYKGNEKTTADEDCDGIGGIDVYLLDMNSKTVISKTRTETCGDFFFANVPEGNYIVKLSGVFAGKKGYDIYMKSKTDLLGSIEQTGEPVQLFLNTGGANDGMTQKAGISTSRSNIRTKSIAIIEADLDGDGEFESLRATATFSDGSSQDITSAVRATAISNAVVLQGDALQMGRRRVEVLKSNKQGDPRANRLSAVAIKNTGGQLTATGTFSDGNTRDITEDLVVNTAHAGVRQFNITISDSDDDGIADAIIKTKTKSNQSNDRMFAGDVDDDGIWSPRSNTKMLRVASGDVDGDGRAEMLIGGAIPGGSVISAARMPGDPIPGIDVKLGKNPGGQMLHTVLANEYGEFEFTNLAAGDYLITMQQNIIINDETVVTVTSDAAENINTSEANIGKDKLVRKGWDGVVKGRTINSGDIGMIAMDANEPTTFRWTPLVPKPKEPVTYRLRVWQLMQGQNGTQAMRSNKPVAEKTVTNTTEASIQGILTGPCKPPYLCDFIWSVQAVTNNGKSISSAYDNQASSFSVQQDDNEDAVTKAQDHNSSRSNKTASIITDDPTILDSKDDNTVLNEPDAKNPITFRWTPLVPKPKEPVTYRLRVWQLMQGQNGTQAMRSNKPVAEKTVTNTTEASIQGILTGPCKPPYLCDFIWSVETINAAGKSTGNGYSEGGSFRVKQPDDTEEPDANLQNNNTVRSNRTGNALFINDNNSDPSSIAIDESGPSRPKTKPVKLTTGPVKWMAPESLKTAIINSQDNLENMQASLDVLDQQLDADQSNAKSLVNTSRSNIKSQRAAISDLEQTLDGLQMKDKEAAMSELEQKRNETDLQFLKLQESLQKMGGPYNTISNVLKSRHDIAMNAIRNMK